ncbi:hypothetical protein HP550_13625 [Cellulomonas humilata]|uniref:Uncharacterized protein n=1 Tax=Cellulomonas humilata TaxID=144055 RepID=A0A7Y6DXA1_9CELL|nr:hypothetical protein [Cellulomonas humilata]NUU18291.1 hypothetical protein [Cellulomonas humilata]
MSMGWDAPAGALLGRTPATWAGLWSLLYTAGHSALRLSLVGQFAESVQLAFVAMDLREARDELEWLHDDVGAGAPAADLGPLRPGEDRDAACGVVLRLVGTALEVSHVLAERQIDSAELSCLTRVEHRLQSARATISGLRL